MSNSTRSPSWSVLKPSPLISEWWTKQSFDPSSGVTKPKPFASLNHLTVPVVRILLYLLGVCRAPRRGESVLVGNPSDTASPAPLAMGVSMKKGPGSSTQVPATLVLPLEERNQLDKALLRTTRQKVPPSRSFQTRSASPRAPRPRRPRTPLRLRHVVGGLHPGDGVLHQLGRVLELQLPLDVGPVRLDRLDAQVQPVGHRARRHPL